MADDQRSNELLQKFLKARIGLVEKHFAEVSSKLSTYVKKEDNVSRFADDFAKSISQYAAKEDLNRTVRECLGQFSDILVAVQEQRSCRVQRIQVKAVSELLHYVPICKKIKIDVKKCFESQEKVLQKKSNLEKVRRKSLGNEQKIELAEREVSHVQKIASFENLELSQKMENFESCKISDMKEILLALINIEIVFHAKALELFTTAYNVIDSIKVEEDLQEFKDCYCSYIGNIPPSYSNQNKQKTDGENEPTLEERDSSKVNSSENHEEYLSFTKVGKHECGDH